jgi:hypothetical protein
MTSHSRRWLRAFAPIFVVAAGMGVAGCASLPEDAPVMERLDTETGITVGRLGSPVELYRDTFLQDAAGRFAFIAPFETNNMGTREHFLWIALPVTPAPDEDPSIEINGATLSLTVAGRDAQAAGLAKSPYKIPTPWSAMYYYKLDQALLSRLGEASQITIRVTEATKKGTAKTVFSAPITDTRLKEFAAR